MEQMKIQFFNHACFSVEYKNNLLLCDPYLDGTAFNDGWDLIVEGISFEFDYKKNNFIYFSHEHPDHFSISFLKSISQDFRSKITIIYQTTKSGRVANFLKSIGYEVIEVSDKDQFKIGEGFFITIGQVPFYDSWALININGYKIVNANDCILETPHRVNDIKKVSQGCDVLFTQFSYANWVEGGSEITTARNELAEEKLRRIQIQASTLSARFVVPFASMVRFCHEENNYMNDSVNTPLRAIDYINNSTNAEAYLMVPYEIWNGIDSKDNTTAVEFWENAYNMAMNRALIKSNKSIDGYELKEASKSMIKRVKSVNNWLFISVLSHFKLLPELTIHISDLGENYSFSWSKGFQKIDDISVDLTLNSNSVYFLFSFDFGVDTLNVNARFSGSLLSKKRLIRCFSPLALNNMGLYISLNGILNILTDKAFLKQGLRTIGLIK